MKGKHRHSIRRYGILRGASAACLALLMLGMTPMLALADTINGSDIEPATLGGTNGTPALTLPANGGPSGGIVNGVNSNPTAVVSGVGGCASGLLASILSQIGFSVAGATLGKTTSEAGKAAAAGASALGIGESSLAVPTSDTPTHLGEAGNALSGFGDTISNTISAIANNQSLGIQSQQMTNSFLGCIARSIARALLQQITVSTVNWINSGFNGSPSFVTNPTQFFENTANVAAGNYLAGSDLAFLCSPFSAQVKIAVAQAYASSYYAPSCNIVGNFTNFMSGFQNGGWPSMLSLTTSPNNNPFGAYISAQSGLNAAVANAQNNIQRQLQLSGGFLDFQQQQNCTITNAPPAASPNVSVTALTASQAASSATANQDFSSDAGTTEYRVCNLVTVTPGSVISNSLSKVLGTNIDSLNAVHDFDQIISALITQLIQRTLYGGLLNLGGATGDYGATVTGGVDSITALQSDILANVPSYLQSASQAEGIYQQDVNEITPVAAAASSALACLKNADGYSGLAAGEQGTVTSNLGTVQGDVDQINGYLSTYGADLTNAQNGVNLLNQFENAANSTTDAGTLETMAANFTAAISNSDFPDQSTVNGAEEDEQTLSVNVNNIQNDVAPILSACQALNVPARTPGAPDAKPAPSCTLTATPASVQSGQPFTLAWQSSNATQGSIDNGIGSVAVSGSQAVYSPTNGTENITYTGSFSGAGGSTSCTASVNIAPPQSQFEYTGGGQ